MTFHPFPFPDELLLVIFSHLPLRDIKCLRLVCHSFLICSSHYLLWSLNICSAVQSLHFYRKISTNDLFRRGISKLVYNTTLEISRTADWDNVNSYVQQTPAPDAFDQCYTVYDLLCYGIPRLPMLREIIITDRILHLSTEPSSTSLFVNSPEINRTRTRDGQLSLFILLRALSAVNVNSRPQTFRISLQSFIPGTLLLAPSCKTESETSSYGTGYGAPSSPSLYERCLTTSIPIFEHLRHLSIITQSPVAQTSIEHTSPTFTKNLCAFISTAGCQLQILEVAIHEFYGSQTRLDNLLFSTTLFSIAPDHFPCLRNVMLKGVSMEGFSLIAFLSRASSTLGELRLVETRLIPSSPDWAAIVNDLCLLLGVQFDDGSIKYEEGRKRRARIRRRQIEGVMPMERIRLEMESVFEPGDVRMERGISIGSKQLQSYFSGREDNPLTSCYESFVI